MTLAKKSDRGKKPKKGTPLGWYIAGLLSGRLDTAEAMAELLGAERAERLLAGLSRVVWQDLGTAHPHGEKVTQPARAKFRKEPVRAADALETRLACVHLLKAYERVSLEHRRACSSALFRGHSHREVNVSTEPGVVHLKRQYVPGRRAGGGLVAALKRCPRTLDRHVQVLEALGLVNVYQPNKDEVPRQMRGARHAYAVWVFQDEIPREIQRRLVEWWGARKRRDQSVQAVVREASVSSLPQTSTRGAPLHVDAPLRAALERLAGTLDPPS